MSRNLSIVILVALAVRLALLALQGTSAQYAVTPDSHGYMQAAKNISDYGTFSLSSKPPLDLERGRTPGYPFFLSLLDRKIHVVLCAQALLGALSCVFVYLAAKRLWKDDRAALVSGLGLALDPVSVLHGGLVLTETLYVFCFTGAFALMIKAVDYEAVGFWSLSGLLFGVAALVRPIGICYPIFLVWLIFLFVPKIHIRAWGFLAAFGLAAAVGPGIWTVRNHVYA